MLIMIVTIHAIVLGIGAIFTSPLNPPISPVTKGVETRAAINPMRAFYAELPALIAWSKFLVLKLSIPSVRVFTSQEAYTFTEDLTYRSGVWYLFALKAI